jgi:hypothetical protein
MIEPALPPPCACSNTRMRLPTRQPARIAPPFGPAIPVIVDELGELLLKHRSPRDRECRERNPVCPLLVVEHESGPGMWRALLEFRVSE